MVELAPAGSIPSTPALIDQLYPEIATILLFVVAILCMIALLYISLQWE